MCFHMMLLKEGAITSLLNFISEAFNRRLMNLVVRFLETAVNICPFQALPVVFKFSHHSNSVVDLL